MSNFGADYLDAIVDRTLDSVAKEQKCDVRRVGSSVCLDGKGRPIMPWDFALRLDTYLAKYKTKAQTTSYNTFTYTISSLDASVTLHFSIS